VNIESRSADCFVASAVRFPRKNLEKKEDHSTCLVLRVYGLDVLDEAGRGGGEERAGPSRAVNWFWAPFHFFENGSIQGERNASNYSGVFFVCTLSRDAVDWASREEIKYAIAVK
jgi:hypothetical protein